MSRGAANMVMIAEPEWARPRWVQVADVNASWELSRAAPLTCTLPSADAHKLGFGNDLRFKWILWLDGYSPPWGGIIRDAPTEGRILNLTAYTFHTILSGRIVEPTWDIPTAAPGAMARRLLWNAHTDARLPFAAISCDEAGALTDMATRGEDVETLLERLADDAGHWFDLPVDARGAISFAWRQMFRDRTGEILLAEGMQAARVALSPTAQGTVNDVIAIGAERTFGRAFRSEAFDGDSIRERGRWQETIEVPTVKTRSLLKAYARRELVKGADPPTIGTVLLPYRSLWARRLSLGDRVRVWSHSANREVSFKAATRNTIPGRSHEFTGICESLM